MTMFLLDIDLDFFYNDPLDWTQVRNKKRWNGSAEALEFFAQIPAKERELVIDHHEVLNHWDKRKIKDAVCCHVDAHHDAYSNNAFIWRRPQGSRGKMIGVGDFIFQALREDIIKDFNWCRPPVEVKSDSIEDLKQQLGPRLSSKVNGTFWPNLDLPFKEADLLTISISPEWLNPDDESWLSDSLEKFGFSPKELNKALERTRLRMEQVRNNSEHMEPYRYRFPESYV